MKPFVPAVAVFLIFGLSLNGEAQTVTANNEPWATLVPGGTCTGCTITIPAGYTLLLNSSGTCDGCTFNGGTVNITSNFTFSNHLTTFNNDTVLINKAASFWSVNFNNDSVAVNFALSSQNNTSTVSHTRINMAANATFNAGTFSNDSIHVGSNIFKVNNTPADFSSTEIDVSGSGAFNTPGSTFTNSNVTLSGTSSMTLSNSMVLDGTSVTLHGNATLNSNGTSNIKNSSSLVMDGSNVFTASNALPIANSSITISSSSKITAASITATSSTINMSGSTTLNSSNAITLTGSTLSASGSAAITASSATIQTNSNLTMAGTSTLSSSNAIDFNASTAALNGNSSVTASDKVIVENGSSVVIGDGPSASTAHMSSNNAMQVLDSSQVKITNDNNYFFTNNNNFQGGSTSYAIKTNTISCNHGAVTTFANSCASGYVYGCATMNASGAVQCLILALSAPRLTASTSGGEVTLSWEANNNSSVDRFLIQRSFSGYDWTLVGEVAANIYQSDYSIKDAHAQPGINYYRLQQVDMDGHSVLSAISSIKLDASIDVHTGVFPNPIKGHTFYLKTSSTEAVILKVFTVSGQPLLLSSLKGQTQYTVQLPASLVSNAYIIVQVIGNGRTQTYTVLAQ